MKNRNSRLKSFNPNSTRLHHKLSGLWTNANTMVLFAYEGVLIAFINNLINNNNNLFATRLGASDFQLTLIIALPQLVGMLVLLPGGILTDRMSNKKRMVIFSLSVLLVVYFVLGFVPFLGKYSLTAFLVLLAVSVGPMTMYNASWQAYFSDVVPIKERNMAFTLRTKWTFLVNIGTPLLTGILLASAASTSGKIRLHQSFFWLSCILILLQILTLKRISGGTAHVHSSVSLSELGAAAKALVHNKAFLGFLAVALLFYMSWQIDWTLYYIGQVKYLKLNEAWLSYCNVGGAAMQLLTIGFWSRINEKHGIRFSIIMGGLGLCFFPLAMIISTSLPANVGPYIFFLLSTASNFGFATVSLNILQCLLQVIPEKNKTLSISIYTLFISLSNAFMPMVGVKVYTVFGADLRALHITFFIIFAARIISTSLWAFRWWLLRNEPK